MSHRDEPAPWLWYQTLLVAAIVFMILALVGAGS